MKISTEQMIEGLARAWRAHLQGKDIVPYPKLIAKFDELTHEQFDKVHRTGCIHA